MITQLLTESEKVYVCYGAILNVFTTGSITL